LSIWIVLGIQDISLIAPNSKQVFLSFFNNTKGKNTERKSNPIKDFLGFVSAFITDWKHPFKN